MSWLKVIFACLVVYFLFDLGSVQWQVAACVIGLLAGSLYLEERVRELSTEIVILKKKMEEVHRL